MQQSEQTEVIKIEHLVKRYKLYDKPVDRLKESLGFSKRQLYKEHYALNDVSFTINRGETVGIIGTNGAGKSTILKIITGVLHPTSGGVTVNGRISALLELGAGFNGEYTGIENVYLNGTMLGFSKEEIDAKLDEILSFADIGDFVHQPVKTYSSGMFVRLAFAVAINIEPEILIVDEALSVGDVFFQAKCFRKFEEFKNMGKTIVFVSHDLSSINKYCDRAILLDHGNKLAEGTPAEMIGIYKKVLVNQYDAASAMANEVKKERGQAGEAEDKQETFQSDDLDKNQKDGASGNPDEKNKDDQISNPDIKQKEAQSGNLDEKHRGEQSGNQATKQNVVPAAGNMEPLPSRYQLSDDFTWKDQLSLNPKVDDYGSQKAKIIDFAIIDYQGNITNTIEKGTEFAIRIKAEFYESLSEPVLAVTIKNLQGTDITGTNTLFEKKSTGNPARGDIVCATFVQKMTLQGGEYLVSFGCTGFHEADFTVYHRLYDVVSLTVISDKNTVGFYDMESAVYVEEQ